MILPLLAKTTSFMSNKTCRIGGVFFLFDSHATLLYRKLILVNTTPLCGYGAPCVWNWRAFINWLIPGSPPSSACRLESLGTRLSAHMPKEKLGTSGQQKMGNLSFPNERTTTGTLKVNRTSISGGLHLYTMN